MARKDNTNTDAFMVQKKINILYKKLSSHVENLRLINAPFAFDVYNAWGPTGPSALNKHQIQCKCINLSHSQGATLAKHIVIHKQTKQTKTKTKTKQNKTKKTKGRVFTLVALTRGLLHGLWNQVNGQKRVKNQCLGLIFRDGVYQKCMCKRVWIFS